MVEMITAGIDCGARNTKTVIMKDGSVIGRGSVLTGFDQEKAIYESFESALEDAGVTRQEIERIGGTGSGKDFIRTADSPLDDIRAVSRGGGYFFADAGTVIDVGAEEGRAVRIDQKGNVIDSEINERCAAGTGTFIEDMARILEIPLGEMGPLALQSDRGIAMNAQCAVFAESEVVGLIHAGTAREDISRAVHEAVAARIVSMILRVGVSEDVVMLGGVAFNPAIVEAVRRALKVEKIYIPDNPQFGAAVGAALLAAEGM